MKVLIIVGLLCAVSCKPAENTDYLDDGQADDYLDYAEPEVPEESNANLAKSEDDDKSVHIVSQAQKFVKNLGETVTFPCDINTPGFVKIWRKNGAILFQAEMALAKAENLELLKNGSLKISNLSEKDAGQYECSALVSKKYKPKIVHTLELNTPPRIESLTAKGNHDVLHNGDTLKLICRASGYPKPIISWHKGGVRLPFEGEILEIDNVKHHNVGEYTCFADNKNGEPAFKTIRIKMEFEPIVSVEEMSVSSDHGTSARLECTVHSEPPANVVWAKDRMNIINSEHTELTNEKNHHFLTIRNLQESDFGTYTCSAVNYLGNANKTIRLVKTPVILGLPVKTRSDTKKDLVTWQVMSTSDIVEHELEYRKKGESDWHVEKPEVKNDEENIQTVTFELKGLDPDVYEARVRSRNRHGWSEYSEIINFDGVFVKHGHHKSHKKGHREGKAKHTPPTQEKSGTTHSSNNSLNSGEPAEHQENFTTKDASVKGPEISGSSSLMPTVMLFSASLIFILEIRLSIIRI